MKKTYELVVAYAPAAGAEEDGAARKVVEEIIAKHKGTVVATDDWGEKALAYTVKGHDRGLYVLYNIELEADRANRLREQIRHEKGVLRWLLVLADNSKKQV